VYTGPEPYFNYGMILQTDYSTLFMGFNGSTYLTACGDELCWSSFNCTY